MSISTVTSEALQLKLRQLLPSQQGFGTDLSASDTIIPIIDLTASAEGSDVREDLQKALAFGSQAAFAVTNTTTTIINTTGFYRIIGTALNVIGGGSTNEANFRLNDGSTTKDVWGSHGLGSGTNGAMITPFDFIVFLGVGESCEAECTSNAQKLIGSSRQIADVNGTLVQPVGFTPQ